MIFIVKPKLLWKYKLHSLGKACLILRNIVGAHVILYRVIIMWFIKWFFTAQTNSRDLKYWTLLVCCKSDSVSMWILWNTLITQDTTNVHLGGKITEALHSCQGCVKCRDSVSGVRFSYRHSHQVQSEKITTNE